MLHPPDPKGKFCHRSLLAAIAKVVPVERIDAVLDKEGAREQRARRFNMRSIVMLCIAMNLYTDLALPQVLRKLVQGVRFLDPDSRELLPCASAITYRRYRLGASPLVALFRQVCRPMATPRTKGAFLFGLRVMAIDGTKEDVPDTAENEAAFGRPGTSNGREGAFPQVLGVYLVETGTHAVVDAGFWPCHTSERKGGLRVLRSVGPGMLVTWDRGFHSHEMVTQTRARRAHILGRLPASAKPKVVSVLPDGTRIVELLPGRKQRKRGKKGKRQHRQGEKPKPIRVRLIEYTVTNPKAPGYGEKYRLITTLFSWRKYPALELACAYHERWETETVIDELDTHQRLAGRPLRSKKPAGVIQELYGLLIAHHAVRSLMHEAALQADIDPDRLSFTHSLEVVKDAIPDFQKVAAEELPRFHAWLLWEITTQRLPERRNRSNPRVVKRKMSNFLLKRKESWPGYIKLPAFKDMVSLI